VNTSSRLCRMLLFDPELHENGLGNNRLTQRNDCSK
jgi:hypothetical protein